MQAESGVLSGVPVGHDSHYRGLQSPSGRSHVPQRVPNDCCRNPDERRKLHASAADRDVPCALYACSRWLPCAQYRDHEVPFGLVYDDQGHIS